MDSTTCQRMESIKTLFTNSTYMFLMRELIPYLVCMWRSFLYIGHYGIEYIIIYSIGFIIIFPIYILEKHIGRLKNFKRPEYLKAIHIAYAFIIQPVYISIIGTSFIYSMNTYDNISMSSNKTEFEIVEENIYHIKTILPYKLLLCIIAISFIGLGGLCRFSDNRYKYQVSKIIPIFLVPFMSVILLIISIMSICYIGFDMSILTINVKNFTNIRIYLAALYQIFCSTNIGTGSNICLSDESKKYRFKLNIITVIIFHYIICGLSTLIIFIILSLVTNEIRYDIDSIFIYCIILINRFPFYSKHIISVSFFIGFTIIGFNSEILTNYSVMNVKKNKHILVIVCLQIPICILYIIYPELPILIDDNNIITIMISTLILLYLIKRNKILQRPWEYLIYPLIIMITMIIILTMNTTHPTVYTFNIHNYSIFIVLFYVFQIIPYVKRRYYIIKRYICKKRGVILLQ